MIKINVNRVETFDPNTSTFDVLPAKTFRFEHSLKAISKWEQKWCISLLSNLPNLTQVQLIDYFCCMCLDDDFTQAYLTADVVHLLRDYMDKKQTATTIHSQKNTSSKGKHIYTSEEIYAYMVLANIPFECDEWNIERLFVLINSISILGGTKKKMSKKEVNALYNEINARNRKEYNSRG